MIYLHQLAVEQQASIPIPGSGVTIFGCFRTSTFSWLQAGLALFGCHIFLTVQQLLTSRGSVKQESVYSIQELHLRGYLAQGQNTRVCTVVGQLAAIKLVDLLQSPDMKSALQHEAHMTIR